MRKLFILLVALIAVPAFALTVTLVDNGDNTVDVTYDAAGDANQPRAFALTVSVSGGAIITGVTAAIEGESDAGNLGFGIFPGTIDINGVTGVVNSYGSPVAPDSDPGAAGTGLGTDSVVLELGSLYVGAANAPPESGTLATLTIDCNGATDVNVTAAEEDQYRGGIVLEDGSSATVAIAELTSTTSCAAAAECIKPTAPEYADWVAFGKPDCWCYRRQCRGDINGQTTGPFPVQLLDLQALSAAFNKFDAQLPADGICADINHLRTGPFRVQLLDLQILASYFNKFLAQTPQCDLDGDGVLTPADKYNFWTN